MIIPDLPPDEERLFNAAAAKQGLAQVFLIAPTTDDTRSAMIARSSKGFIYYVSLRGVTGGRKALPEDVGYQKDPENDEKTRSGVPRAGRK